jgi:hypothetical protein
MRAPEAIGDRARLDVADHGAGGDHVDLAALSTLPSSSPAITTFSARTLPVSFAPAFDGEVALHVDVALELAGDADAARAFDLAFDGDFGGDQRLAARARRLIGRADGVGEVRACRSNPWLSVPAWWGPGGSERAGVRCCLSRWP